MILRHNTKKPETECDLFSNIKCLLVTGRLLFLLPCDGLSWKSHHNFTFRRNSFPTAMALLIITWYIVKDIISLKFLMQISQGGVVGYVHPAHYFIVSLIISSLYLYSFLNTHKLKQLFVTWENASTSLTLKAFSLRRVSRLAILTMIPPLLVNSAFAIDSLYRLDGRERIVPENYTLLEYSYDRLPKNWNSIVPYSPQFAIVTFADFIYGALPRAFAFPLIITFSYALSSQFKELYELGLKQVDKIDTEASSDKAKMTEGDDDDDDNDEEKAFWRNLVKRHNGLTQLVAEFDDYLSPIILITYVMSLYLICMQLLRALSSSMGVAGTELTLGMSPIIYNASFFVETCILYGVSISAAQINDYAHKIGNVLRRCPPEFQTSEITRLENRVNCGPRIGFTGLGCFVITKPFLLTLANTAITIQIVLLQAQMSHPPVFEEKLIFQSSS